MILLLAPVALGAQVGLAIAAAVTAPRRGAVVALAGVLALPWLVPAALVPVRGLAALVAVVVCMRGVELLRERPARPVEVRIAHALSIPDLRLVRAVAPAFDARLLAGGVACGVASLLALSGASAAPAAWSAGPLLARWGLGGAAFYLAFEAIDRCARATYLLVGLRVEPTQRTPLAARTVAEFWGLRWNAIVRRWLASVAFRPLARRGRPDLGSLAAFALSAAIHAYIVLPALGPGAAALMGAFFLLHGGIVASERALGIARAPAWVGHLWTLAWLLATAPVFVEPLVRLAGLPSLEP